MKTKILSKLMLVCFTAVMIAGFSGKLLAQTKQNSSESTKTSNVNTSKQILKASDCRVCDKSDIHLITLESAINMIKDFHNKILKDGNITNSGGYFSTIENPNPPNDYKPLTLYNTFKLHWAVEDSLNTGGKQRLFITFEPSEQYCDNNNRYSGIQGLEGNYLQTTFAINDISPFTDISNEVTHQMIYNRLGQIFSINNTYNYKRIVEKQSNDPTARTAISFLNAFKTHRDLYGLYQCDDLVFNKLLSIDQIEAVTKNTSFFYFFGYDEEQTYHRLRLIIAGFENSNNGIKIRLFDAGGISLLRESSRPRP